MSILQPVIDAMVNPEAFQKMWTGEQGISTPPGPAVIKPFDVVRLKSGGPAMTVLSIDDGVPIIENYPAHIATAVCTYWVNNSLRESKFQIGALIHYTEPK